MLHVYLLRCADGTQYVDSCEVLEKRVAAHRRGDGTVWTAQRLPVELVYSEQLPTRAAAFARERQIKRWTRAKKEALIAGEIDGLRALAKRRGLPTLGPGPVISDLRVRVAGASRGAGMLPG